MGKTKGMGDVIEKITTATGIKKVVDTVSKATGKDCGCAKRKEALNNPNLLVNKMFNKSRIFSLTFVSIKVGLSKWVPP